MNNVAHSGEATDKQFLWPDNAVFLLIDLYREHEAAFSAGFTRSNVLWAEIAQLMNRNITNYTLTAQQCTNKWSGLKRSYKNIVDQNKQSGKCRNSWTFFSAMDSIFQKKASTRPPAEATSDGPASSEPMPSTSQTSSADAPVSVAPLKKNPVRKRKVETILEDYIADIREEREKTKKNRIEESERREEVKAERHKKRQAERAQMHSDRMKMQQALVDVSKTLAAEKI